MDKQSPARERFYELDLIRFVAAMMVVFFHYLFRGNAGLDPFTQIETLFSVPILRYGYLGVDLFFMISGFVILLTAQSNCFRDFVFSRLIRLYPAYWICIFITAFFIVILGGTKFSITWQQVLVNLTMLQEVLGVDNVDGVYWTLLVEIKFYVLVAITLFFNGLGRLNTLLMLWLIATFAERVLIPNLYVKYFLITEWSPYFIAGATFYLVRVGGWSSKKVLIICAALILALHNAVAKMSSMEIELATEYSAYTVSTIIILFFLLMLVVATRRMEWANTQKMYVWGAISYPLYLLHQFVGYIFINSFSPLWDHNVVVIGVVLLLLVMSFLVVRYIETPVRKWLVLKFSS